MQLYRFLENKGMFTFIPCHHRHIFTVGTLLAFHHSIYSHFSTDANKIAKRSVQCSLERTGAQCVTSSFAELNAEMREESATQPVRPAPAGQYAVRPGGWTCRNGARSFEMWLLGRDIFSFPFIPHGFRVTIKKVYFPNLVLEAFLCRRTNRQ